MNGPMREPKSEPKSEPTAVVLLAHGSPDPDWRRPLDALVQQLDGLEQTVVVAYLQFLAPTLAEAIEGLARQGHRHVLVLSAFLSPGGRHIKEDVPRLVAEQAAAHPQLRIQLRPGALGAEPEVVEALAVATQRCIHEASSG